MPIRVLVCDESPAMRTALGDVLSRQPDMVRVGNVRDAAAARALVRTHRPDVVIVAGALAEAFAGLHPIPVVVNRGHAIAHADSGRSARTVEPSGAVPGSPRVQSGDALHAYAGHIVERARIAAQAHRTSMAAATRSPAVGTVPGAGGCGAGAGGETSMRAVSSRVIVIGASTGGTEAIKEVLQALPASMPPILVVQHMPEMFTPSFARRLDGLSALHVKEAEDGERIVSGTVYLAPGHSHLAIARTTGSYQCTLSRGAPVNRHRPSVDVLFHSAAEQVGAGAIGMLLTGMGKDGARGLLALREAGAWTMAQDRDSCVVYGMPREAVALGAAHEVLALQELAGRLQHHLRAGTAA